MKKVWIVDDDQEMIDAIRLMLEMLDFQVTSFLSARKAAKKILEGIRPDLLMLDINMPEVSGLDLLEFLRRRPEGKGIPIVMLSTEAADVTVDKALELGANSYAMKPVTLEELKRAINTALQQPQKE
jgi:two-component system chemotaxis response regulator CheY